MRGKEAEVKGDRSRRIRREKKGNVGSRCNVEAQECLVHRKG